VPTYDDYIALGINTSNTTILSSDLGSLISTGSDALGNGKVIGIQNGLYVVNNGMSMHILNAAIFNVFRFNWSNIPGYPFSITTDYPIASTDLQKVLTVDGNYNFTATGQRLSLSPSLVASYGLKTSLFTPITKEVSQRMVNPIYMSKFLYNKDDGRIYYASGGAIHYVATYNAFVAYGGLTTPLSTVNTDIINSFNIGQTVY
jgi:hypothetical protein